MKKSKKKVSKKKTSKKRFSSSVKDAKRTKAKKKNTGAVRYSKKLQSQTIIEEHDTLMGVAVPKPPKKK